MTLEHADGRAESLRQAATRVPSARAGTRAAWAGWRAGTTGRCKNPRRVEPPYPVAREGCEPTCACVACSARGQVTSWIPLHGELAGRPREGHAVRSLLGCAPHLRFATAVFQNQRSRTGAGCRGTRSRGCGSRCGWGGTSVTDHRVACWIHPGCVSRTSLCTRPRRRRTQVLGQ